MGRFAEKILIKAQFKRKQALGHNWNKAEVKSFFQDLENMGEHVSKYKQAAYFPCLSYSCPLSQPGNPEVLNLELDCCEFSKKL